MTDRIAKMAEYCMNNEIYPAAVLPKFDEADMLLSDSKRNAKRACEYMLAQNVRIDDDARFAGLIKFDSAEFPGDIFRRQGHKHFRAVKDVFYANPQENLSTFEWQHSTPDFTFVINNGIKGLKAKIASSKDTHKDNPASVDYLEALDIVCDGIIAWAHKCADECEKKSSEAKTDDRKNELLKMAQILRKVPENPAETFRETIQTVFFCFHFLPDSIGTPDRYLYKSYIKEISEGTITREDAKELIQEWFITINGFTNCKTSWAGDKGGESHFAIGGYTKDGEDGFNELSRLIIEAMMEMPVYRPQVSLRWTPKTPSEVLYYVLDCERHDKYKRIAVVNDEPRVKGFMHNVGVSFEDAINYTMVGCNEPAFCGSIWMGGNTGNIARSLVNTLYDKKEAVLKCQSFDEFYALYEKELHSDLDRLFWYGNHYNNLRSYDTNVISSLFINGCIENAKSVEKGGARINITGSNLMGFVCVIDSISIIKQFVFDEKIVTMKEMLDALCANWSGYEELRSQILRKGKFFGNNYETSDEVSNRFTESLYKFAHGRKDKFGNSILFGTLTGYNPHYAWFGKKTKATPDGRFDGEPFMVGVGQSRGKDREGLTALLTSVAGVDKFGILCGPFVCNVLLEESLIRNDDNFGKTVKILETYLKMGGLHFQLNYVSREELIAAKNNPDDYASLRVRVSGFSGYFTKLNEHIQDNVIARTEIKS
ncbi:MAG: hypothetical protein IKU43_05210 [Clostridia bacterium]|nr:hypothetical protein [Clostridia bacterium]